MTIEDLKIYGLNSSVMAISFTQLEMTLKIMSHFGIKYKWEDNTITIEPQLSYSS